jgi:hypothetical protein
MALAIYEYCRFISFHQTSAFKIILSARSRFAILDFWNEDSETCRQAKETFGRNRDLGDRDFSSAFDRNNVLVRSMTAR